MTNLQLEDDWESNIRFFELQRFLERKTHSRRLFYQLHRDFNVQSYSNQRPYIEMLKTLEHEKTTILKYLIDQKIVVHWEGVPYPTGDLLQLFKNNTEATFKAYLDNFLGHVTLLQVDSLYGKHYYLNKQLGDIYGCLEYDKASNG